MTTPTIDGKIRTYSASAALQAVGDSLTEIKFQDGLTWADLGAVLGRSDDQAAKYADGTAEMGISTYGRAAVQWNGRFTGRLDRLILNSRPSGMCCNKILTAVIVAGLEIQKAKADDNLVSDSEVDDCRPQLQAAYDALGELLSRGRK